MEESVIALALSMTAHQVFDGTPLQIRAVQTPRIKQHFLNIRGQRISIPDTKMVELMSAKKELSGCNGASKRS